MPPTMPHHIEWKLKQHEKARERLATILKRTLYGTGNLEKREAQRLDDLLHCLDNYALYLCKVEGYEDAPKLLLNGLAKVALDDKAFAAIKKYLAVFQTGFTTPLTRLLALAQLHTTLQRAHQQATSLRNNTSTLMGVRASENASAFHWQVEALSLQTAALLKQLESLALQLPTVDRPEQQP